MSEATVYRNALELNTTLGEYRLQSVLGVGGFGMTYLAWDQHLEKHVAIKEYLPGDLAVRALDGSVVPVSTDHKNDYQWGLERFILEARTLARFSHPHIVRVNRYFEANGTGYMVMDYEEGESLNQLLKRAPLPAEDELRRILLPLLDGLAAVHAAQFLHRDIKPSNIFMRANGTPVLLDFGAARATGGGTRNLTAVLTPGYAPLEQYATDGRQGPWSDIYAMGGVLFRAVADRNPPDAVNRLQGDTVKEGLSTAQGRYSAPLLRAIEWALAVKPELRPQSVAEWKAAFDARSAVPSPQPASRQAATTATVRTVAATAPATRPATPPPVPVQQDHGATWRRIGWMALWVVAAVIAVGWYQRRPPPPVPVVTVQPVVPPSRPDSGSAVADRARERVGEEFRGADRDGDGYLSPLEVEGQFPVIARDFGSVDRDGDRRISLHEFVELRRRQFENRKVPPLAR